MQGVARGQGSPPVDAREPTPASSLTARVASWGCEDVCDYVFYLVWVCGVAVHHRYVAALLPYTTAGSAGAENAAPADPAQGQCPRGRSEGKRPRGSDRDNALFCRSVQRVIFPRVCARAGTAQAQVRRLLAHTAKHPSPSVVVGLALAGGPTQEDGGYTSRVREVPTATGSDPLLPEVLALRRATDSDGADGWAERAFAVALAEAVALERRLGVRHGLGCRLLPAPSVRRGHGWVNVDADAGDGSAVAEGGDASPSPTVQVLSSSSQGSTRTLQEYFHALTQKSTTRRSAQRNAPGDEKQGMQGCATPDTAGEVVVISDAEEDD